jgi:hypothetical protein
MVWETHPANSIIVQTAYARADRDLSLVILSLPKMGLAQTASEPTGQVEHERALRAVCTRKQKPHRGFFYK